jgi:hypothetical protein
MWTLEFWDKWPHYLLAKSSTPEFWGHISLPHQLETAGFQNPLPPEALHWLLRTKVGKDRLLHQTGWLTTYGEV